MPRAPFAIMIAMTTFLAIPAPSAWAQELATDATTPMDKAVGNETPPTDNTLSNAEVKQLEQENAATRSMPAPGTSATAATTPEVSGTTAVYKEKSGSAAQTEGQ